MVRPGRAGQTRTGQPHGSLRRETPTRADRRRVPPDRVTARPDLRPNLRDALRGPRVIPLAPTTPSRARIRRFTGTGEARMTSAPPSASRGCSTGSWRQSPRVRRIGRPADGWFPQVAAGPRLAGGLSTIAGAATAAGHDPRQIGMEGRISWRPSGADRHETHRTPAEPGSDSRPNRHDRHRPSRGRRHLDALTRAAGHSDSPANDPVLRQREQALSAAMGCRALDPARYQA